MRWLLLDEIVAIEKGIAAHAVSKIPSALYSAEVLMLEMMAQTGGVLVGAESDFRHNVIFTKITEAFFNDALFLSGQRISIIAKATNLRKEGALIEASVSSIDGCVAQSRLMLQSVGDILPGRSKSITFHDQFMEHFKVREKMKPLHV